ncbi:MAG: hypothetical protein RL199_787 [Pseudomonadota bacterium]|jgi:hypothetical protein
MASPLHDAAVEALRLDPSIALEAVASAFPGTVEVPSPVFVGDPVLRNLRNTEHLADLVLLVGDPDRPSMAIVVEVQLAPDEHKPWRWPLYVVSLADRHRCPVHLVVVAMRPEVEAWALKLPQVSPSFVLKPVVLGPQRMPRPDVLATDNPTAARLLLSLVMHVRGRKDARLANVLEEMTPAGVDDFGGWEDYTRLLGALLLKVLPASLEDDMNIDLGEEGVLYDKLVARARARGLEQGIEQGIEQGLERGRLQEGRELFASLAAVRGWSLTPPQLALLHATVDPARLRRWCGLLLTCTGVDEVMAS